MSAALSAASAARSGSPPRWIGQKAEEAGEGVAVGLDRVGGGVPLLLQPGQEADRAASAVMRTGFRLARSAAAASGRARRADGDQAVSARTDHGHAV